MGIVRKQSIYSFLFIFIGFFIGAANVLLLFTNFLTQEEYGLTNVFRQFYTLFSTLATFGSITAFYKFYPLYQNRLGKERNDLPFLVLLVCFAGCVLLIAGSVLFKDLIIRKYSEHSPLFVRHFYLVLPLTVSTILMNLFEGYAYMLKRTVISNIVKEVGFRLVQTVLIVLYAFKVIHIDTFFLLFSLMYIPSIAVMIFLVFSNNGVKINFRISGLTKRIYRKIASFSLFHFSGSIIAILPMTMNGILIASLSKNGLADVGVYGIAVFMISVLDVPLRGIRGIGIATISEAFHENDMEKIKRLYQKTSLNLLIVGICLYGLIYPNIENVISFSKGKDFHPAIMIFMISGTAKLIELSMGMNDRILGLSRHWKVEFFITTSVILLSIPANYFLIRANPLLGAAIGDALILFLFCLLRFIAVWRLYKMQPFTRKTLAVTGIGLICLLLTLLIPRMPHAVVDLGIRCAVFLTLFAIPVLALGISKDMNELYRMALQKTLKR